MLDKLLWKIASQETSCFKKSIKYRSSPLQIKSSHRSSSIKKLFLKILQYLQENNYVGVSF